MNSWTIVFVLFLMTPSNTFGWVYCSQYGYCLEIPDSMVVISAANYQDYADKLPKKIVSEFKAGSKRDIVIDKPTGSFSGKSFFVVDVESAAMKNIDVERTCRAYRDIEGDNLKACEVIKNGFWALTYRPGLLSYSRVWLKLDSKHHLYAVSAQRFGSEYQFRLVSYGMLKILKTLKRQ